jgi:type IV pilus assembly protein PilO
MAMDQKQQNNVALGLIGLVLAGGFYMFFIKKRNKEIGDLNVQIAKLDTLNMTLDQEYKRAGGMMHMAQTVETYAQHMKKLEELIPQRADVPGLIYAIAEEAQIANVAWGSINPIIEEPVAYYSRQVYDIQVSGTYHDIGTYLAGIASLRRIIKPMDLNLTLDPNAKPRADGSPQLTAKFSIETYVIPAPSELKPDSTKKGA